MGIGHAPLQHHDRSESNGWSRQPFMLIGAEFALESFRDLWFARKMTMNRTKSANPSHRIGDLDRMNNLQILEAVREMEARFKSHSAASINDDHRQHLSHTELKNVFHLACHLVALRNCDVAVDAN